MFVTSPLTASDKGDIVFTSIEMADKAMDDGLLGSYLYDPNFDVAASYLVKINSADKVKFAEMKDMLKGAKVKGDAPKKATSTCKSSFGLSELPQAPSRNAVVTNNVTCGSIRPGINSGPAIDKKGVIYFGVRNHFISRFSYLLAVNPDLSGKWISSLRHLFNDGCGVTYPNGVPGGCRAGSKNNVDPALKSLEVVLLILSLPVQLLHQMVQFILEFTPPTTGSKDI